MMPSKKTTLAAAKPVGDREHPAYLITGDEVEAAKAMLRPAMQEFLAIRDRNKAEVVAAAARVAHWKMLRRWFREDADGKLRLAGARYDEAQGDAFIAQARAGDPVAIRALRSVAMHFIETNDRMPPTLASYVDQTLSDGLPKERPGTVANSEAATIVDSFILALEVKFGFTPTRNETTTRPSACSIIAEVWTELVGEEVPESRVKDLWKQRRGPRRRLPGKGSD